MYRLSWFFLHASMLIYTQEALGKTWEFAPNSPISHLNVKSLQNKFPEINSPEDLNRLLQTIALDEPMAEVSAEDLDDKILIRIVGANLIHLLRVTSFTRSIRLEVEGKISKYIGMTDSQEVRQQISDEIFKILKNQGYFLAKVELNRQSEAAGQVYEAVIDEDYPCTITSIELGFNLPVGIENPFQKDMYCDSEDIRSRLTQLENKLVKAGYNQQRMQSPDLAFDPKSNTAILKITGSLGKKIRYGVNSSIKTPGLISLIFGDQLNSLDSSITDPDAMLSELIRQYRNQGFDDVEIAPARMLQPDPETIEYQFEVKPGPEYLVSDVQFEGLSAMSEADATEAMNLTTSLGNQPIFSQDLTRQARDALLNLYKERGFWDAKIFEPRVIKNPNLGEVKLIFVIKEDKRRLFDALIVNGNKALGTDEIEEMLGIKNKEPFAWQRLIDFEKELRARYKAKGYLAVNMDLELVLNRQFRDIEAKVLLRIQEQNRSKFSDIVVKGLVKTASDVVTRELRFQPGDWYDPTKVEESRQALVDLGLFSSVSLVPSDSTMMNTDSVAYTVLVREARSGTVSFGPGWSLVDGMRFSVEGSYNNIGGRGRKLFSKGSLSQEKNQTPLADKTLLGRYAGIGYLEPYLFNYPVDGTLTFSHKGVARVQSWEISRSAEAIASHRIRSFTPQTDLSIFTMYKETREEAEAGIKRATLMESGILQVRELGVRQVTDARNNKGWPTLGYRFALELSTADFVFGGDLKYTKWSASYNIYREIWPNLVLAAGVGFTSYNNILRRDAPNVLPTSERLPSGGPESNRGFRDNSLGPVFVTSDSNGKSLEIYDGGSRRSSQRCELRYQLIQNTFAITSFIDANNSFFSPREENLIRQAFANDENTDSKAPEFLDNEPYQLDALVRHPQYIWTKNYVSYGFAGNLLTPLGSANISFGWPWRRCLNNADECQFPRGNGNYRQLRGAVLGINVGANF